jgi:H+/Cl- antiporter ClcA
VYELPIFIAIGIVGGFLGAGFNDINERMSLYRKEYLNAFKWKRLLELVLITLLMSFISFILPLCWQHCTEIPTEKINLSLQDLNLLDNSF